jgi:polar amino acid transport system permease protein
MNTIAYQWDFSFLSAYAPLLWSGLWYTMLYTGGTIVCGLAIGLVTGLMRMSANRLVRFPAAAFIEIFRCTPLLVQLVWFYYALPVLLGVEMSAYTAAALVLSFYTAAFYAEIFRGGVLSLDRGQWDAAAAIGMRYGQLMRHVILPQAVRRMTPPFINQSIIQLKNTSLVSTIAVTDLLYQGMTITSATYRPLEVYTLIAVIYFAVLFPLTILAQMLEKRLRRAE